MNISAQSTQKSTFFHYLQLLRVRQWSKNALLFAGFVFAGRLRIPDGIDIFGAEIARVILAFVCFCALSSITYIINDWRDIPLDRLHPIKKNRPLASGVIAIPQALAAAVALSLLAIFCAAGIFLLDAATWGFAVTAAGYMAFSLAYSLVLKHLVIVDVLCVSIGFVLRVVAGCLAIPVFISPWILLCTFNLALFVVLCKRRAELVVLGDGSGTRKVLSEYSLALLDPFIAACAAISIIAYSLYTFSASHADALGALGDTPLLMLTIPLVVYGIFRYWYLALNTEVGQTPERMLLDLPLLINAILWGISVVILTVIANL